MRIALAYTYEETVEVPDSELPPEPEPGDLQGWEAWDAEVFKLAMRHMTGSEMEGEWDWDEV